MTDIRHSGVALGFVALFLLLSVPVLARGAAPSAAATPADSSGGEEAAQLPPTAEQSLFAARYIKAVNAKDLAALRRLLPPRVLACYNARNEPYLSHWLKRQIEDPVAAPYTITVEKRDAGELPRSALITLPVLPTHQLNIATKLNGEDVVLGRPIAYLDGQWYEAGPCPTDVGLEQFEQRQKLAAEENQKIDALLAALKDPMLGQLKTLIAQDKILEACRKYSTANQIAYGTGCEVVRKLASNMRVRK